MLGFGFGVLSIGFWVWGFRFRGIIYWVARFWVWGFKYRVLGLGFLVWRDFILGC